MLWRYLGVSSLLLAYLTSHFGSVAQLRLTLSDHMDWSLMNRLPCSSPTPRACSNSCPLSGWCYSTISPSVIPFSSYLQSFPAPGFFPSESVLCIRWSNYWNFSFSISPSNEYSGLISFRMDWLDLLTVQGTLKSCLQHQSSRTSILQCSAFFMVQFSYPYMTTGKIIAWIRWTLVG